MAILLKTEILEKVKKDIHIKRALEDHFAKGDKPLSTRMLDIYLYQNSSRLTEYGALMVISSRLRLPMDELISVGD